MEQENSGHSQRNIFNIFNYPKFQYPMVGVISLTFLSTLIIFGGYIFFLCRIINVVAQKTELSLAIWDLVWKYGLISLLANVLVFILILFWGLILTHRMNGPIPRLKQELEQMYDNEDSHLLYVRENDYLGPFIEKLNKVLMSLMEKEDNTKKSDE